MTIAYRGTSRIVQSDIPQTSTEFLEPQARLTKKLLIMQKFCKNLDSETFNRISDYRLLI